MPGPSTPEPVIRLLARKRIATGTLPVLRVSDLDAGYGGGDSCCVCDEQINALQVQYDVQAPHRRLRFHIKCFALWQLECARLIEASGASPPRDPRATDDDGSMDPSNGSGGSLARPRVNWLGPAFRAL